MLLNYGKNVTTNPRRSHPKLNKPLDEVSSKYEHSKQKISHFPSEKSLDKKAPHSHLQKSWNLNLEIPSSKFKKKSYLHLPISNVKSYTDSMANQNSPVSLKSIMSSKLDLQGEIEDHMGNPLKNLCNYLNDRDFKAESKEFQSVFCQVFEESQKLENKLKLLHEEYTRLQKLNKYLSYSHKYKEDMLGNSQDENRKLTDQLRK